MLLIRSICDFFFFKKRGIYHGGVAAQIQVMSRVLQGSLPRMTPGGSPQKSPRLHVLSHFAASKNVGLQNGPHISTTSPSKQETPSSSSHSTCKTLVPPPDAVGRERDTDEGMGFEGNG